MKKSRVFINTNLSSYINFFTSYFSQKKLELIFLKKLRIFLNVKNLILTSQGRVAIFLIAKILIKKKKRVFLASPYTLTEALNAIKYAGGKIEFVDIDINTGLPKIRDLQSKINNKTCAILVTHLYSSEKNIKRFFKVFKNQIIIEDTAINFGAKLNKNYLGTLANFGFYSFGTMKNLCLFNGGLIYCKKDEDYQKIKFIEKKLSNYPFFKFLKKIFLALIIDIAYNKYIYTLLTHHILKFVYKFEIKSILKIIYPGLFPIQKLHAPISYNYKYQSMNSKNGSKLLENVRYDHGQRIIKAKLYNKHLNSKTLKKFRFQSYFENSFLEYPILCKENSKIKILKKLFKNGYDIRYKWYIDNSKFFGKKIFKNSKYLEDNILCLPTNKNFTSNDIKKICYLINNLKDVK